VLYTIIRTLQILLQRTRLNRGEVQHCHDLDLVGQPKMDEQGLDEYVDIDHYRHLITLVQS
jgi:hypothetical protein